MGGTPLTREVELLLGFWEASSKVLKLSKKEKSLTLNLEGHSFLAGEKPKDRMGLERTRKRGAKEDLEL